MTIAIRFLLRGILTNTLSSDREQNVGSATFAAERVGLDTVDCALGEEPRAGGRGLKDSGPVAVVPPPPPPPGGGGSGRQALL
jgi:hypothetical protein